MVECLPSKLRAISSKPIIGRKEGGREGGKEGGRE
jgi:hypothetical protein